PIPLSLRPSLMRARTSRSRAVRYATRLSTSILRLPRVGAREPPDRWTSRADGSRGGHNKSTRHHRVEFGLNGRRSYRHGNSSDERTPHTPDFQALGGGPRDDPSSFVDQGNHRRAAAPAQRSSSEVIDGDNQRTGRK